MNITETSVRLQEPGNTGVLAFIDVVFDDELRVCNLVIKNIIDKNTQREKTIISFPSRKLKDGRFKDVTYPINKEFFNYVYTEVMASYRQAVEEDQKAGQKPVNENPVEPERLSSNV